MGLKLEVGKYYMDGNGCIHGPMEKSGEGAFKYISLPTNEEFTDNGLWSTDELYASAKRNLTHEVTIAKVEPPAHSTVLTRSRKQKHTYWGAL